MLKIFFFLPLGGEKEESVVGLTMCDVANVTGLRRSEKCIHVMFPQLVLVNPSYNNGRNAVTVLITQCTVVAMVLQVVWEAANAATADAATARQRIVATERRHPHHSRNAIAW